jgi:hypothetical protein
MFRKMLLVTPENFERQRNHKIEIEDTKKVARLLKHKSKKRKKPSHDPYDTWFQLRHVQDPILRSGQKRRQPVSLTLVTERPLRSDRNPDVGGGGNKGEVEPDGRKSRGRISDRSPAPISPRMSGTVELWTPCMGSAESRRTGRS